MKPKILPASAMMRNGADFKRMVYHVEVDADVTLDDILRPGYWLHYADVLKRGDLIDVMSDVLDVQLRVMGKGVGFVQVRARILIAKAGVASPVPEPEAPAFPLPDNYEIKKGPGGRLRVFQKDPLLEISAKTFLTEREAVDAAIAHHKAANEAVAA